MNKITITYLIHPGYASFLAPFTGEAVVDEVAIPASYTWEQFEKNRDKFDKAVEEKIAAYKARTNVLHTKVDIFCDNEHETFLF